MNTTIDDHCTKGDHLALRILIFIELFLLPLIIIFSVIVLMTLLINQYLQTAPNVLFCNLVFADLVSAVLRFPYYINYDLTDVCEEKGDNELLCVVDKITTYMLDFELTILVCMSLERYIAINYAVWHIKYVTLRNILMISGFILCCHMSSKFGAVLLAAGNNARPLSNVTLCIEDSDLPTTYSYIHNILTATQIVVCLVVTVQITRKTTRRTFNEGDNLSGKALPIEQVYEFTEVENVEEVDCMQVTNMLLCILIVLDEFIIHADFLEGEIGYGYKKVVTFLDTLCSTVGVLAIVIIKPLFRKCVIELMTTPPCRWRTLRRSLEDVYLKDAIAYLRRSRRLGTMSFALNTRELDDLERMLNRESPRSRPGKKDSSKRRQSTSVDSNKSGCRDSNRTEAHLSKRTVEIIQWNGSEKSGKSGKSELSGKSGSSEKSGKSVLPRLFGPSLTYRTYKLHYSNEVMDIIRTAGTPV